jgi:hypothetical protein
MNIRNLDDIRSRDPKFAEALEDIVGRLSTVAQQVNANPEGPPAPPNSPNAIAVTAQHGYFTIAISDQSQQLYRNVNYFIEHSAHPDFRDPQIVHIGTTRNAVLNLGNVTRYFRAYSAYPTSASSAPVYHGSAGKPLPVSGGGTGAAAFLPSQGSGTGSQGQGLSGFGPIPYRTTTGGPPIR